MLKFTSNYIKKTEENNQEVINKAFNLLKEERESNKVGYYNLPVDSLSHIERIEKMNFDNIKQVVVMGIGGSSLGIKAIESILQPYTEDTKEMLFLENSDPITLLETIEKIEKDRAIFFIISKSGSTIETTSTLKTLIHHLNIDLDGDDKKRLFAITDNNSVLSNFAKHHGLNEFNIPDNVGGRFSVLSAVGIIPLTIAGYDTRAILDGAGQFIENFFNKKENHILDKACYLYENSGTKPISVLFSYADRLENLTKWFVQLWGESLGKIDKDGKRVGLTPIGLTGAVDQHSFLQLIIEGPKDKIITFITIEDFQRDLDVPNITLEGIEKTNFINGTSFNTLINAQADATKQSIIESGIDTDSISIDKITSENIGALLAYYEVLTSLVGAMLNVNTYNQPGVELGKVILYKNLGE
ncbi:Glucose-6-phosphate isomerase [hydrothermal vent metagenome]|uniref:glucose-6-phosphate isomerase n=1 Tax=hydrothermal vent metagenome TaxID=652676 RepID=A0A1W1C3D7_9ZZZZ